MPLRLCREATACRSGVHGRLREYSVLLLLCRNQLSIGGPEAASEHLRLQLQELRDPRIRFFHLLSHRDLIGTAPSALPVLPLPGRLRCQLPCRGQRRRYFST